MNFRILAALVAAGLASASLADELPGTPPGTQPVMLRSNETLPVVDRVVVHKAQRRLDLMHGGNVVRCYHVALGLNPIGTEGALGRLPHAGGRLPPGPAQLPQRLLSVDQGFLSERRGSAARARAALADRRLDHDSRAAESA